MAAVDTKRAALAPPEADLARLAIGEHHDPHAILGTHATTGGTVVRAFHPDASGATLMRAGADPEPMTNVGSGVWAVLMPESPPIGYRLRFSFPDGNDWERDDPYRFTPSIGDLDLHLITEGTHERLYDVLGAHRRTMDGTNGVAFAVWAPNARGVRVVGDFDRWDGRLFPMRSMGRSGIWELFVPDIGPGEIYKFEILGKDSSLRLKADPLAFSMQVRPETACRVIGLRAAAG